MRAARATAARVNPASSRNVASSRPMDRRSSSARRGAEATSRSELPAHDAHPSTRHLRGTHRAVGLGLPEREGRRRVGGRAGPLRRAPRDEFPLAGRRAAPSGTGSRVRPYRQCRTRAARSPSRAATQEGLRATRGGALGGGPAEIPQRLPAGSRNARRPGPGGPGATTPHPTPSALTVRRPGRPRSESDRFDRAHYYHDPSPTWRRRRRRAGLDPHAAVSSRTIS